MIIINEEERMKIFGMHFATFMDNVNIYELEKRILKYKSIDKSKMSKAELSMLISDTIGDWMLLVFPYHYDKNSINLYRVRKIDCLQKLNSFEYPSDYWEPPFCKSYGRLNEPYENNLYLADNPKTAIDEARVEKGDFLVLSKFCINNQISIENLLFTRTKIDQNNYLKKMGINLSPKAQRAFEMYNDFFSSLFYANDSDKTLRYMQSNAIIKPYHDFPNTEGWVYESTKTGQGTLNICLKSKIAHEKLKLKSSLVIYITNKNDSSFSFKYIGIRPTDNNYILPFKSINCSSSILISDYFPEMKI